jgi:DNA polymerase-3 subunit delta
MYKREFDELIKNRNLPKSILLYGDEFATNSYAKFLTKRFAEGAEIASYYFDEYDYESAKNFISQASLFGDRNVLYIKSDKKIPTKELKFFIDTCKKGEDSYFVYEYLGDAKGGAALGKSFTKSKSATFVRFFKPTFYEAMDILQNQAKKIGLDIDSYALRELYLVHSEDMALSVNELEKLLLLDRKVTQKDIERYVYGMGEISIDSFMSDLLAKEDIKVEVERMLESGFDEIRLLNQIESYISTLALFRIYITAYGSVDVVDILGYKLPANIVKTRVAQSTKISLESFEKILRELLEAEFKMKFEQNIDKNLLLYSTLIKLQTYL